MTPDGFRLLPARLGPAEQRALAEEVPRLADEAAPFYRPVTPGGRPMSVAMTNFGPLGWVTDAGGYRYQRAHPVTGAPWPDMPSALFALWSEVSPETPCDCCLVNRYDAAAKMGLHRDSDEADFGFPVVSVSLGDTALFRIGGLKRSDPTRQLRLASGDVVVLAGEARLAYHGVDRIIAGSSRLIAGGGRINLTLRRAAPA